MSGAIVEGTTAWYLESRDQVLLLAETFGLAQAISPEQRRLLGTALAGLRSQIGEHPFLPFIHLPLLVYAGLRGDDKPARPLAVVTCLLFLGFDILDDLADGDLAGRWEGYRPAEIQLVATGLLSAIPQLALTELDVPPDTIVRMQRTLARGLVRMGAGQQSDLRRAGSGQVNLAEVEDSVLAKSGEELAVFAALAAQLAGAAETSVEQYAAFGRALGVGIQFASDCRDILSAPRSRDLANGTRTLPIALHLARLTRTQAGDFLQLLEEARRDDAAQVAVRERLLAAGQLRRAGFVVEVYRQRALRALDQANPRDPARTRLQMLLKGTSLARSGQVG